MNKVENFYKVKDIYFVPILTFNFPGEMLKVQGVVYKCCLRL